MENTRQTLTKRQLDKLMGQFALFYLHIAGEGTKKISFNSTLESREGKIKYEQIKRGILATMTEIEEHLYNS